MFPCSNCHASLEVNRKKRELKDEHSDIKLHHAETMRWCLDCHEARNRDKLRLFNGSSSTSQKATNSVASVMEMFTKPGDGDPW